MAQNPLLSIVITSYTMERFKDICDLLDSIKAQTILNQSQAVSPQSEVVSPKSLDIGHRTSDIGHLLEVIFVAERSRELYEKVKEKGREILGESVGTHAHLGGINQTYSTQQTLPTQQTGVSLKVLWNHGEPGASAARNLGIRNARGEIVAFVDDDVVLFPDWAEKMVGIYEDNSIIGATGPAYPLWEDPKMSWLPEEFHWIVSCTSWFKCNEIREVRHVWFENASFRRESFNLAGYLNITLGPQDSLGGFKQRELKKGIISEDAELSLRIRKKTGKRIVYNPEAKVWHKVRKERLSWKYIIQWSFWMGASKRKLKRLCKELNIGIDPLGQEHQLLKCIFIRLPPRISKEFFRTPAIAWRRLSVALVALFFVALGYYFPRRGSNDR